MKKFILTLLAGLFFVVGLTACSEKENPNADVVVFSQKGCPHCEHALAFLNGELQQIVPDTQIQNYDIRASRHNYELFRHVIRTYKLDDKPVGTPLIVVNKEVIVGWTPENQQKLTELVQIKKSKQ